MDIRHFRHFLAVADELHFGRAARRLNMEQAPLSQSIRRFETDLGVELFERSRRGGTRLTPAGALMANEARLAVAQFDKTVADVRRMSETVREPVSVGFVTAGLMRILPAAVISFREEYAGAEVHLSEAATADLIDRIVAGTLDLAVTNEPTARPTGVAFELLRRDRTIAALPRSHPLATGAEPRLRDLAREPLVFFPRGASPTIYDGILGAFAAAGAEPRVEQRANFMPTILSLVGAGLGYAFVQESARALSFPDVVFRPVPDLPDGLTWDVHLAWKPGGATFGTRMFAAHVRAAAGLRADGP